MKISARGVCNCARIWYDTDETETIRALIPGKRML